jgi:ubiquitin-conjugating enzyme E2 R
MYYRKQVLGTKEEAEKDNVKVPLTLQEYCVSTAPKNESLTDVDFYDDDYADDDDDDDDMYYDDDDDSGNEES